MVDVVEWFAVCRRNTATAVKLEVKLDNSAFLTRLWTLEVSDICNQYMVNKLSILIIHSPRMLSSSHYAKLCLQVKLVHDNIDDIDTNRYAKNYFIAMQLKNVIAVLFYGHNIEW